MEERKEAWLPETALEIIKEYLISLPIEIRRVFEFGSGASTEWFASMANEVVSLEHDMNYFKGGYSENINVQFSELPYNYVIEKWVDNYFDLILVDGRNRQACVRSAIPKLKSGGWLVLDNSERDYYKPAIDMMADWNQIICKQNRPDKYGFTYPNWQCTIFIKP